MQNTKPLHPDMFLLDFTFNFGLNYSKGSEDECWLWTGSKFVKQFNWGTVIQGRIKFKGKTYYASRVAYYLHYKKDPGVLSVLHRCDNYLCVNPFHFFLGTQKDNVHDCHSKGRNANVSGEKNPAAKITDVDTENLRVLHSTGQYTHQELADLFKISRPMVTMILNNKRR